MSRQEQDVLEFTGRQILDLGREVTDQGGVGFPVHHHRELALRHTGRLQFLVGHGQTGTGSEVVQEW